MTYDASNIHIRSDAKFLWEVVASLADKYDKDPSWIERSLHACDLCNVDHEYFIQRYLIGDKTVPLNSEVNQVSFELQKQMSQK